MKVDQNLLYEFFNNLKRSAQLKNYKKIIIFISRSYLKKTKINKYQGNIKVVTVNTIFSKGLFKIIYDQIIFPFLTFLYKSANYILSNELLSINIFFILKKKIILGIHSNLPWYYPELSPGHFKKNSHKIFNDKVNSCGKQNYFLFKKFKK